MVNRKYAPDLASSPRPVTPKIGSKIDKVAHWFGSPKTVQSIEREKQLENNIRVEPNSAHETAPHSNLLDASVEVLNLRRRFVEPRDSREEEAWRVLSRAFRKLDELAQAARVEAMRGRFQEIPQDDEN